MKQQRNYVRLGSPSGGDGGCLFYLVLLALLGVAFLVGIVHKYF